MAITGVSARFRNSITSLVSRSLARASDVNSLVQVLLSNMLGMRPITEPAWEDWTLTDNLGDASIDGTELVLTIPAGAQPNYGAGFNTAPKARILHGADPLLCQALFRVVSFTTPTAGTMHIEVLLNDNGETKGFGLGISGDGSLFGVTQGNVTSGSEAAGTFPATGEGWVAIRRVGTLISAYWGIGTTTEPPAEDAWNLISSSDTAGATGSDSVTLAVKQFGGASASDGSVRFAGQVITNLGGRIS